MATAFKAGPLAWGQPKKRGSLMTRPAAAVVSKLGNDDEGTQADQGEKIEAILSLDEHGAHTLSDKKRGPLVIPLLTENNWRNVPAEIPTPTTTTTAATTAEATTSEQVPTKVPKILTEDEEAIAALLAEAKTGNEKDKDKDGKVLPMLARNQPPGINDLTSETDKFRLDVSLRPEESSLAEYEAVPVEEFGAALLRGMGWQDGKAIGRNGEGLLAPLEFVPRQHRLGLGAAPKPDFLKLEEPGKRKRAQNEESSSRSDAGNERSSTFKKEKK